MSLKVLGTGSYTPPRIVTNDEIGTMVETSDEWIRERTGISRRHVCTTQTAADLAYEAGKRALEQAGTSPEELDLILCATVSADDASPTMSCTVQALLGASCPAIDINAACPAFIYLLETAAAFFALGRYHKILIIGAERMSRVLDWDDRSTCVIFGDGAGAMVLEPGENLLAVTLFAEGGDDVIKVPLHAGKSPFYELKTKKPYIHMNGQETYKFAVHRMCTDVREVIERAGIFIEDVRFVVAHQANVRIIDAAKRRLNIPDEKMPVNISEYGNTSAASIPLLIDELNRAGKITRGDIMVLTAFGGGLSSGACVLRW